MRTKGEHKGIKMTDKSAYTGDKMGAYFEEFREAYTSSGRNTTTPSMYDVVLLNDDFTPPDYILSVLKNSFNLAHEHAVHMMLMLQQHNEVVCGTYTREVAETKMIDIINGSQENNHSLRCVIRREIN